MDFICDFSDAADAPPDLGDPEGADPGSYDPLLRKWDEHYDDVVAAVYNYAPERDVIESGEGFLIESGEIIEGSYTLDSSDVVLFENAQAPDDDELILTESSFRERFHSTRESAEIALNSGIARSNVGLPYRVRRQRWDPGTIYYWSDLDSKFNEYELPWVLDYWDRVTPYEFEEVATEADCISKEQCIVFIGHKSLCQTNIGRREPSVVLVAKEESCRGKDRWILGWKHGGGVLHEMGHVLGLGHEHQRPDAYLHGVTPVVSNVKSGEENQIEPDEQIDSIGHGLFSKESVMMYHRKAFSKNRKTTLKGAPKKTNRTKLMRYDVAGVLAANFWRSLYLTERTRFTGNRRRIDASPDNMWVAYRGPDGDFGSIGDNEIGGIIVPGGVTLRLHDSAHGNSGEVSIAGFGPRHSFNELDNDISRIQMRPGVTLFKEQGYNEFPYVFGPMPSPVEMNIPLIIAKFSSGVDSLIVGHGLRAQVCHGSNVFDPASWNCEIFSSGQHIDEGHGDPLRSLDVQAGVTLYARGDFDFERDRLIETLVPNLNGSAREWEEDDLLEIESLPDVNGIYVHPGISVDVCDGAVCRRYDSTAVEQLPDDVEDPDLIRVHSAVTLFDDDHCDAGSLNQTFRIGTYTSNNGDFDIIGNNNVESMIIGPGLTVTICDNPDGTGDCSTYEAVGEYWRNGFIVDSIKPELHNDVSYLRIARSLPPI